MVNYNKEADRARLDLLRDVFGNMSAAAHFDYGMLNVIEHVRSDVLCAYLRCNVFTAKVYNELCEMYGVTP